MSLELSEVAIVMILSLMWVMSQGGSAPRAVGRKPESALWAA